MAQEFQVITAHVVNVSITSTISSFASQKRFEKDLTIFALKGKLELITGGSAGTMVLQLFNKDDKLVTSLDNNEALLGSYPVDDGMRIHVIDKTAKLGEFDDVSKVEKFELKEEEYAQRSDSVRAFKQRMKMGRFADSDPEEQKRKEEEFKQKKEEEESLLAAMTVGDRCEVKVVGQPTKRGAVMFLGKTFFKEGNWVGVKYDEPLGKNDGSVQGKRYFECPPKYGGFVKPNQVTVGDFPEDMDFEDDEM